MQKWQLLVLCGVLFGAGWATPQLPTWWRQLRAGELTSPFVQPTPKPELPLLQYSIPNLRQRSYQASPITIVRELEEKPSYTSYVFSYKTGGKTISGQLNLPKKPKTTSNPPVIVMLRGYVPLEIFSTGVGTRNAAAVLADAGYITLAPDFLGYGESDPELEDSWEARFIKPVQVVELIKSIEQYGVPVPEQTETLTSTRIGIWAHSNGGQIALTTLEALSRPIPTTLWAPVTVPFPYSILFFGDEVADEGKAQRLWLAQFERQYDVFAFSLTQHLDQLTGPIQLHHGTADEAALKVWSDEFADKIELENTRREELLEAAATLSAQTATASPLPAIELIYHTYPGANHNLQPGWDTVVQRDVAFFDRELL